nr:nodulation protein W, putative [Tanacetum cinerariifolium]
ILLTGHGDVPMAVDAMRDGAYDFLEKPFTPQTLLGSLHRGLEKRRLVLENRRLHEQADNRSRLEATLLGLSPSIQTLRRQDRRLERLGSNQSIEVDLRIVAATKPDLLEEARSGRFREDLAYRLNIAELRLPPLRERREDIPLLFSHFSRQAAERLGRSAPVLGLENPASVDMPAGQSLAAQQEAFEAHCLRSALSRHKGDIKAVLNELQLPRRTLNEKMQRHGLIREVFLPDNGDPL